MKNSQIIDVDILPSTALYCHVYFSLAVTYTRKKSNKHLLNFGYRSARDRGLKGYVY